MTKFRLYDFTCFNTSVWFWEMAWANKDLVAAKSISQGGHGSSLDIRDLLCQLFNVIIE